MAICDKCDGSGKFHSWNCSRCLGTGVAVIGAAYAGIGSRETPEPVLKEMENIGLQLALRGFVLRSGGAKGADSAFERASDMVHGRKLIRTSTLAQAALDHAAQFHPAWNQCSENVKGLHARNSLILLGDWLDDPARFVVCWTEGGAIVGGTGQGLRIAAAYNIPVFNLAVTPVAALWKSLAR